jgi:serine/threonine protein kinase
MGKELEEIESILYEAIGKGNAEVREAYLAKTCGTNTKLRAEIDSLLSVYADETGILKIPLDLLKEPNSTITETSGMLIDRYKLLEKIGEGGMAVVYMAEQQKPIHRKVALKIIKLGMDTKSVIARFEAERQALALMDHPNIAKVLDAGATETGRPYFVMELVKGVSITKYCDNNKISTQKRLDLFQQVCNAVQHAHQKGIIHRDIKPSNIMVTSHDGKPVPKIIDFGIAKAINQRLTEKTLFTRYAQIIGTPTYMSPEQAELNGLDVDTRSDIYSLGALLYELLTGTTPFSEEKLREVGYIAMQKIIREQEPVRPSTKLSKLTNMAYEVADHRGTTPELLGRMLRRDLDWIVVKALEKDRTRRYDTAHALAEDIRRYLKNEPITAGSPSLTYRIRKFCRRNRSHIAIAVVVLILLIVSAVGILTYLHNIEVKWARQEALPMITKLVEQNDYLAAFFLARQVEKYIPEDPVLLKLWPDISRSYTVRTEPEGTDVYYKEYSDIEGEWLYLGRSPLESIRFPRGDYRWKLVKEGFETRECGIGGIRDIIAVKLLPENNYPEMLYISSRRYGDYLMDKYEVTNAQYKKFVDDGGYDKKEYWKHRFVREGQDVSWQQALNNLSTKQI